MQEPKSYWYAVRQKAPKHTTARSEGGQVAIQ